MTIFNECNIVNLLETTLFHGAAVESLGDAAVDLADYCVRQMTAITVEEAGGAATDAEYERKDPIAKAQRAQIFHHNILSISLESGTQSSRRRRSGRPRPAAHRSPSQKVRTP